MRITLLGTGSADGWPNPFCACASCEAERADGRSRAPSSALVDGVVLIDCGPTTPYLPARSGLTLARVQHVLLTHGHPDHLHPAFLLSRGWTAQAASLHVWGPAQAIDLCRDWVGPGAPVELHVIEPFATLTLQTTAGDYRLLALPAAHAHGDGDTLAAEALLFDLTAPDGDRLLYATDTGPLPEVTIAAIAGPLDAIVIDETFGDKPDHGTGHLDLTTLPAVIRSLRSTGAAHESTLFVATHLSHHNPPTGDLRNRLSALGVQVLDDLSVVDTQRPGGRAARSRLVLGGARSGKSLHAEQLAAQSSRVLYVATGGERPDDPEWEERVAAHRDRRPAHWSTIETTAVEEALTTADVRSTVLVDCLALWLTAQLDDLDAWSRTDAGQRASVVVDAHARIDALVDALRSCQADVVLVSNEVGMGVVPATTSGRLFRDLLGILNTRVARACDETTLVVAGQAMSLSSPIGGPTRA